MDKVQVLICGNDKREEIINIIENLNSSLNLNLVIKDNSKFTCNQNIECFFSLINNVQYFNALILNFEKKEDIFGFFKLFNSEELGITNECYPFFLLSEQVLSKSEIKNFITEFNKSKEDDYKLKLGNFIFFNEIKGKDFKYNILNIYNCYCQDSKKLKEEDDSKETINILLIGVKNAGKSYLINTLLGETRALSMEHHYTTKLNAYKHRKYPIVFYDISGFNENEDDEIINVNSKIEEFNKEYTNLKKKIHCIFYVIDCNNKRILQNKEKELIEIIFKINIPIFIVGQKAKITNINNFMRKIKFELTTLSNDYKEKIDILSNRIFCLDFSKDSYIKLLESVYDEFLLSKKINEEIINSYSIIDSEEILNNSVSENLSMRDNEEKQKILEIYKQIKKSIFFNNFIEKIKDVYNNVSKIKERYLNDNFYLKNFDVQSLNDEIEKEFLKIFSQSDLEKIYKIIKEQQKDLTQKGKEIKDLSYYFKGSALVAGVTITLGFFFSTFCLITFPVLGVVDYALLNNRDKKTKSLITDNVDNFYKKFEWKYILINLNLIKNKAESYNEVIDEFNKFINDFKNIDFIN